MKVTSTEFRKNLFQIVERALHGELIEIMHKGRLIKLVPGDKPSKLSRLVTRDTIVSPEDLARAQAELDDEMRTSWEKKWAGKTVISYLDTNVVIYLHSNDARLTPRAKQQIETADDLLASAMVMLELEMLYEKGVLRYSACQILADLNQQIGVSVCQLPMATIMNSALIA